MNMWNVQNTTKRWIYQKRNRLTDMENKRVVIRGRRGWQRMRWLDGITDLRKIIVQHLLVNWWNILCIYSLNYNCYNSRMTTLKRNQRSTAFTRGQLIKHHIRVITIMVKGGCINRALSFSEPKCFTSYLFFSLSKCSVEKKAV